MPSLVRRPRKEKNKFGEKFLPQEGTADKGQEAIIGTKMEITRKTLELPHGNRQSLCRNNSSVSREQFEEQTVPSTWKRGRLAISVPHRNHRLQAVRRGIR